MSVTVTDVRTAPFLIKKNQKGDIVLVVCPHPFQLSIDGTPLSASGSIGGGGASGSDGAPGPSGSDGGRKYPVRLAASGSITDPLLSAPAQVDSVALAVSDRILLPIQSDLATCGIYAVSSVGTGADGVWARSLDADGDGDLYAGVEVYVQEGTLNGETKWRLRTTGVITIGATQQDWVVEKTMLRSEATPTTVKSSGAFATSYAYTSAVDVRDYSEAHFMLRVTDVTSVTSIDVVIEASFDSSNWGRVMSDDSIRNGAWSFDDYVGTKTTPTVTNYLLSVPMRSGRYIRIGIKANSATGVFSVDAIRL